jgi:hypothetical protein
VLRTPPAQILPNEQEGERREEVEQEEVAELDKTKERTREDE